MAAVEGEGGSLGAKPSPEKGPIKDTPVETPSEVTTTSGEPPVKSLSSSSLGSLKTPSPKHQHPPSMTPSPVSAPCQKRSIRF